MKKSVFQKAGRVLKEIWDFIRYILKYVKVKISPKSLLTRFILIILIPMVLLQVVASMVFYDNHWRSISRRLANDIAGEVETVIYMIEQYPDSVQTEDVLAYFDQALQLKIHFKPETQIIFDSVNVDNTGLVKQLDRALSKLDYPFVIKENRSQDYIMVYIQLKTGVLKVEVPQKRVFSSTTYAFLVWMIGASILLFWIAFLFMKNQVRSVYRLADAAEKFGTGRAVERFKPEGATEVRQAGQAFLLMKNRIQKYLGERTSMLSGVSHDLRTPLTRMKLQLSMMPDDESTQDLLSDIDEMEKMLEGYLAFARGEGKEPSQVMEVSELLTDVVEKLRRNGHDIDLHIEQTQQISLRPHDFSRAITNILTNAHRYAKHAAVVMGVRDHFLDITIDDDGPGIPKEKRDDVFKAFYRLDDSRNSKTGGVGLGLTITRDIVLSHGGEITLEESPMKGLRVHLRFPL